MSEQPPEVPIVLEEVDFRQMLAREVQRATRYPDFLSLCLVRLNPPSRSDAAINVGIARKLAEMLRASDLVGMVGEDIAVILVHTPDTDAIGISERMQRVLQEFALASSGGGRSGPVSVELALAAFPGDATTVEALLDRAQARLPKLS
jgi:predicted signal transduction protein with EAL and GGDEF domain